MSWKMIRRKLLRAQFEFHRLLISLYYAAKLFAVHLPVMIWGSRSQFIHTLYEALLHRPGDEEGVAYYAALHSEMPIWKWKINRIKDFIRSAEFEEKCSYKDTNAAHHEARCQWITTLPPAGKILDLGGSSAHDTDGALLSMGYKHPCEHITIIDFPPDQRVASSHSRLQEHNHISSRNGAEISFIYDSFVNLERFGDNSFDLIVAGQVIEHISEKDAKRVFASAYRILKPGAEMHLDTPNRYITEMLGSGFIHPEHKIEYYPEHLRHLAESAGFTVKDQGAISPLPRSMVRKRMSLYELSKSTGLSPNPNEGFSFYLAFRK